MRLTTVGVLTMTAGAALTAWAFLSLLMLAASTTGGSGGPMRLSDFMVEHFLVGGPAIFAAGLVLWLAGRAAQRDASSEPPPER